MKSGLFILHQMMHFCGACIGYVCRCAFGTVSKDNYIIVSVICAFEFYFPAFFSNYTQLFFQIHFLFPCHVKYDTKGYSTLIHACLLLHIKKIRALLQCLLHFFGVISKLVFQYPIAMLNISTWFCLCRVYVKRSSHLV